MSNGDLALMTLLAEPETVPRIVFLDMVAILPGPAGALLLLMMTYMIAWEAAPINALR